MSLNLNDPVPPKTSAYYTSPTYTDAVNDAQFVRTFGIVSLVGAILAAIGGAVAIGIGLAVMGFGSTRYYRVLGPAVVILGVLSFLVDPLGFLGSILLSAGIAVKAVGVLTTLAAEGKGDPDWGLTRKRAVTGLVLSAVGFLIGGGWLATYVISRLITR